MGSSFVKPTNYELVELADAIVVAVPTKQTTLFGLGDENEVTFVVKSRIKGDPPDLIISKSSYNRLGVFVRKSDPEDISTAHPESFAGPCSRVTFKRGRPYVLFLSRQDDGSYSIGIKAFLRNAEDYAGPDSIWMKTIEYYLEVQKIEDRYVQLTALKTKYDKLIPAKQGSYEQKLATDIADQLSSTSPYKPSQFLIESYVALDSGQSLPFGIRHPDANKEGGEVDAFTDFVTGVERGEFDVQAQKDYILTSLATEGHPELETKLFFENLYKEENSIPVLAHLLSYLGENGYYEDALNLARIQITPMISTLKEEEARPLLYGLSTMNSSNRYRTTPRWVDHPEAKIWWPKFEYDLVTALNDKFDGDYSVSASVLRALRPTNYRDNPELTIQLANLYDEKGVIDWAEKEVWDLVDNGENPQSDQFALPIEIILLDYYVPEPQKIDKMFCDSRMRPIFLFHLRNSNFENADYLSERLALKSDLMSPSEKQVFLDALMVFSENEGERYDYKNVPELNNVFDEIASLVRRGEAKKPMLPNRYFKYHPVPCE